LALGKHRPVPPSALFLHRNSRRVLPCLSIMPHGRDSTRSPPRTVADGNILWDSPVPDVSLSSSSSPAPQRSILPAGWLGLRVWGRTGPLLGERGGREKAAVWTGAVHVRRCSGTQTSPGRALPGAALSLPLRPRRPRLAATRTGQNRGLPEPNLRTLPARFGSLARGLVGGPRFSRRGGDDDEVVVMTSAAARYRVRLVSRRRSCSVGSN
jgi:hypothetical protein